MAASCLVSGLVPVSMTSRNISSYFTSLINIKKFYITR